MLAKLVFQQSVSSVHVPLAHAVDVADVCLKIVSE
jgi:hypothetical protein